MDERLVKIKPYTPTYTTLPTSSLENWQSKKVATAFSIYLAKLQVKQ